MSDNQENKRFFYNEEAAASMRAEIKQIILKYVEENFNSSVSKAERDLGVTGKRLHNMVKGSLPKLPIDDKTLSFFPKELAETLKSKIIDYNVLKFGLNKNVPDLSSRIKELGDLNELYSQFTKEIDEIDPRPKGHEFFISFIDAIKQKWRMKDPALCEVLGLESHFIPQVRKFKNIPVQTVLMNFCIETVGIAGKEESFINKGSRHLSINDPMIPSELLLSKTNFLDFIHNIYGDRTIAEKYGAKNKNNTAAEGYNAIKRHYKKDLSANLDKAQKSVLARNFYIDTVKHFGLSGYTISLAYSGKRDDSFYDYTTKEGYWFGHKDLSKPAKIMEAIFKGDSENLSETKYLIYGLPFEDKPEKYYITQAIQGKIYPGDLVHYLRIKNNKPLDDLAKETGGSRDTLHDLENSKYITQNINLAEKLDGIFDLKLSKSDIKELNRAFVGYFINFDKSIIQRLNNTVDLIRNKGAIINEDASIECPAQEKVISVPDAMKILIKNRGRSIETISQKIHNGLAIKSMNALIEEGVLIDFHKDANYLDQLTSLARELGIPKIHRSNFADAIYFLSNAKMETYKDKAIYKSNIKTIQITERKAYNPETLAKLQGTIEQVDWANSGAKARIEPDDIIKLGAAITQLQETAGMSDEDVVKGLNGFDIENFQELKTRNVLPSTITENSKIYYLKPLLQNLGVPESHHEPLAEAIYKLHTLKGDLEYFLEGGYSGDYQDPDLQIIEQVKKNMGTNKKKDKKDGLMPPEREL